MNLSPMSLDPTLVLRGNQFCAVCLCQVLSAPSLWAYHRTSLHLVPQVLIQVMYWFYKVKLILLLATKYELQFLKFAKSAAKKGLKNPFSVFVDFVNGPRSPVYLAMMKEPAVAST